MIFNGSFVALLKDYFLAAKEVQPICSCPTSLYLFFSASPSLAPFIEQGHHESIMKRAKASVRTVQTQLSFVNHSGNTPEFQQEQKELSKTPESCRKYLRSGEEQAKRFMMIVTWCLSTVLT